MGTVYLLSKLLFGAVECRGRHFRGRNGMDQAYWLLEYDTDIDISDGLAQGDDAELRRSMFFRFFTKIYIFTCLLKFLCWL